MRIRRGTAYLLFRFKSSASISRSKIPSCHASLPSSPLTDSLQHSVHHVLIFYLSNSYQRHQGNIKGKSNSISTHFSSLLASYFTPTLRVICPEARLSIAGACVCGRFAPTL